MSEKTAKKMKQLSLEFTYFAIWLLTTSKSILPISSEGLDGQSELSKYLTFVFVDNDENQ